MSANSETPEQALERRLSDWIVGYGDILDEATMEQFLSEYSGNLPDSAMQRLRVLAKNLKK